MATPQQQATNDAFFESRRLANTYPQNLTYKSVSAAGLLSYRTRIDAIQEALLVTADPVIYIREFTHGQPTINGRVKDINALKRTLGEHRGTPREPIVPPPGVNFLKEDPTCRFCFISANGNSAEPLSITRPMLDTPLTHHQVMPNYLDFISVFGDSEKPQNLRFSSFRDQSLLTRSCSELAVPGLGRSSKLYQMCFNLKSIAKMEQPLTDGSQEWRVRQAAIYHQFDVDKGKTVWIITQGRSDIRDRVKTLFDIPNAQTFDTKEGCFRTTLDCQMMLCEWSTENWRDHLQYLEETVEAGTDRAVHGVQNGQIEPKDLLKVQLLEEKADEAIMLLQANTEIIESIRKYYDKLKDNSAFTLEQNARDEIVTFTNQLQDMVSDCRLQIIRAQLLVRIASNRKSLINQQLTAQASDRMEKMTRSMYNFTSMAQKETIAVKAIAVVTLFYLPGTFVSSFFSTDVVKFQDETKFSYVAIISWAVATLILTVITGWIASKYFLQSDKKRKQELKRLADEFSA